MMELYEKVPKQSINKPIPIKVTLGICRKHLQNRTGKTPAFKM